MWRALRDIVKNTTFYYKQLNLFLLIGLVLSVVWVAHKYYASLALNASTIFTRNKTQSVNKPNSFDIVIGSDGKVAINGRQTRGTITFGETEDEFLYLLVPSADVYIDSIQATVHLPADKDPRLVRHKFYAIHGVESEREEEINSTTMRFIATSVPPGAEVSVHYWFPKDYFALSSFDRIRSQIQVISKRQWIIIGIFLPSLSVLFLLYLLFQRMFALWRVRNRMPVNVAPSSTIAPAIIGALYHGYIGKKEITATIFDLARRGFINVHLGDEDEIIFARGSSLYSTKANLLRPYEIFLLHQIFGEEGFASHGITITNGLNSELFSSKIALTILNIYDATVAEGYFIKSPNTYYLKYKISGMILFFIALVALVYDAFTLPEPAYILFFWLGMLLSALIIIKLTPGLPRRTRLGDATLKQWLGFRNYLSARQLINAGNTSDFFNNLAYAIVMDCEKEWIARWVEMPIPLPEWFTAEGQLYTAEEFSKSVVTIVEFLAKHLIAARPPDLA